MRIRVLTIDQVTGQPETLRTIDYDVQEQRVWLARHSKYGFCNKKAVMTWAEGAPGDAEAMEQHAGLPRSVRPREAA